MKNCRSVLRRLQNLFFRVNNENFFWFRIDNILHSANMKPINCTVDKVRYSDHYPLWCYLQLKEGD